MQSPTASDPSFKAFLEKLQEQNNRGFVTQLVQLKAEREIAGEDNDKREEQLNDVISSLKEVRVAVTGIKIDIDITPLVNIGENQNRLLEELSRESSLTRKLTEGSVEYDKEAAQYRNTSGRDIESKVSGKTSKDGGFIDFETARDTLSGQGKRAREANAFDLKPINYTPGKSVAAAVGGKSSKAPNKEVEEDTFDSSFLGRIKSFMTDGESDKSGYGIFQKPPKEVEKKEREDKVSSPREVNPEADNIASTGEIQADAAKSDLELSKQMLDTTREQLTVLKEIRDALAPKTPGELTQGGSKGKETPEAKEEEGGGSLIGDLASGAMDLMGGGKKAAGKVAGKAAGLGSKILGGVQAIGGKAVGFANSGAGKLLGSVAAVGLGAYTAYTGISEAEDSKQAKMEEVQAKVKSGEMKPEEAAAARKDIGNSATVEKSGAVGEGTGMAAGAIAGAKLGATVGTFIGGPIGTAVGGLAGGALGAFAGSKAGKYAGEAVGGGISTVKNFFGGSEVASKAKETVESSSSDLETLQAKRDKLAKQGPATNSPQSIKAHETLLNTLDKAIEDKKSNPSQGKLSEAKSVTPVDGRSAMVKQREEGRRTTIGIDPNNAFGSLYEDTPSLMKKADKQSEQATKLGIDPNNATGTYEGGVLTKITDKVSGKDYPIEVPEESRAKVEAARNLRGTGSEIAKTSTENADMTREASGKGGVNNTVVSNNVSSNNTTKFVPMKTNPRPEYTGSALDRYTSRIAVY